MASFITYMKKVRRGSEALDHGRGFGNFLLDKGTRYTGAAFFGFSKGYWREKTLLWGKIPLDVFVGGISTALGAVLDIHAGSQGQRSRFAPTLHALGDTGITSWISSHATAYGAKKSGRQVLVLKAGEKAPTQIPAGFEAVGEMPTALDGAYLTDAELANYKRPR